MKETNVTYLGVMAFTKPAVRLINVINHIEADAIIGTYFTQSIIFMEHHAAHNSLFFGIQMHTIITVKIIVGQYLRFLYHIHILRAFENIGSPHRDLTPIPNLFVVGS